MSRVVRHRVRQFWRHSSARISPGEGARAIEILGPALAPLFVSLPMNERRHGLDVLDSLQRLGPVDGLLAQAALLHDVGKAQVRFSVLDRSLAVFLQALSTPLFQLFLNLRPGYRRRYEVYRDHAARGAARVAALGAGELAAVIAEHHSSNPAHPVARRLRQADGTP